jgi:hypothetical protein
MVGEPEVLAAGVWRARLLQRSLVLVSGRELSVERDSVPVHLLGKEPLPNTPALAQLLGRQPDLWSLYGSWIAGTHPALLEEIRDMARAKKLPFTMDWHRLVEVMGKDEVLREIGQAVDEIGIDNLLAHLTPEQREELRRRLQEPPPSGR